MVFFGGQFLKEFDMGRSWVGGKVGMELGKRSMLLRQVLERSGQGSAGGSRYIKISEGSGYGRSRTRQFKRIAQ